MSDIARFSTKFNDNEEISESEQTAVPFNANAMAKCETIHTLESFANIKEVGQLKNYLAKIEEMYIELATSWKNSEEYQGHVITYLEEQLKTAKANLADAQLIASEGLVAVKEQMRAPQEQMIKQHEDDILELSNIRKVKEGAEQSLQEAKEHIAELNATIVLYKQRVEQAVSELNKRTKELSAASQEINFLKIQLDAEKDILKTTTKNHDQMISYLKEQLRVVKENLVATQVTNLGEVSAVTEQSVESHNRETFEMSDVRKAGAEESLEEVQYPIAELKAQFALNMQKVEQDAVEFDRRKKEFNTVNFQLENNKETAKSTFVDQGDYEETYKQSPILTAQQTREQLKMRLQGLQEVSELDKRRKEFRASSQETSNLKVQPESDNESSKIYTRSQDSGQAVDFRTNVTLSRQRAEQDSSECNKLNNNLNVSSQKIDVFW